VGGFITARNLVSCPFSAEALQSGAGFARVYKGWGTTATDALDHSFFDTLKRQSNANQTSKEDVVVSFFTDRAYEEKLVKSLTCSVSDRKLRCEVCHKEDVEHYVVKEGATEHIPVCGALCGDFHVVYNGKTVFR